LLLRGVLGDGRPFEASACVCADAINLEIGRGNTDVSIDSPSVSRRHACLNGTADALTLTDLGSSNGSSINGVPCLEGEIMYVEPGDTVILGDVRFTVTVVAAGAGGRQE
jgi:pSer/pThr/pTyr-binding forkhead associated (FHA) protein